MSENARVGSPSCIAWCVERDERLKYALRQKFPYISQASLRQIFTQSPPAIFINGKPAHAHLNQSLQIGDRIEIFDARLLAKPFAVASSHIPPLTVLYEDDQLLAIEKPVGVPVHPLHPWESDCVTQIVLRDYPHLSGIGEDRAPALLHRLDNDTSGVLLFAKSQTIFKTLREALQRRLWQKYYLALVCGYLDTPHRCTQMIAHHPKNKKKMIIIPPHRIDQNQPQEAISIVTPLQQNPDTTLVQVQILTGVRHQIRLHLADIGHPIIGDTLYNPNSSASRLMLHAWRILLPSPPLPDFVEITSPIPFMMPSVASS